MALKRHTGLARSFEVEIVLEVRQIAVAMEQLRRIVERELRSLHTAAEEAYQTVHLVELPIDPDSVAVRRCMRW